MSTSLTEIKHIACSRCRERKVKCDGLRPSCRRCLRHGHDCRYITGKKPRAQSEWVQYSRTFSVSPGRTRVKPSASQPAPRPIRTPGSSINGNDVDASGSRGICYIKEMEQLASHTGPSINTKIFDEQKNFGGWFSQSTAYLQFGGTLGDQSHFKSSQSSTYLDTNYSPSYLSTYSYSGMASPTSVPFAYSQASSV